jgi:enoyl-CoA hydratase/carnithine racemase
VAYQDMLVERRSHVAIITLNRPERMNSMGGALVEDAIDALQQLHADRDARCHHHRRGRPGVLRHRLGKGALWRSVRPDRPLSGRGRRVFFAARGRRRQSITRTSDDHREGVTAFREKRAPHFRGR